VFIDAHNRHLDIFISHNLGALQVVVSQVLLLVVLFMESPISIETEQTSRGKKLAISSSFHKGKCIIYFL